MITQKEIIDFANLHKVAITIAPSYIYDNFLVIMTNANPEKECEPIEQHTRYDHGITDDLLEFMANKL